MRARVRDRDAFVQVQFPRPAVVVQPVGDVAVLLNLDQRQAGSDGVHRSRRREERIARVAPATSGAATRFRRSATTSRSRSRMIGSLKPSAMVGVRVGAQHVPHLGLPRAAFPGARLRVVRVHLHREPVGSEDELHQQREFVPAPVGSEEIRLRARASGRESTRPSPVRFWSKVNHTSPIFAPVERNQGSISRRAPDLIAIGRFQP